jgi:hypothetical protein
VLRLKLKFKILKRGGKDGLRRKKKSILKENLPQKNKNQLILKPMKLMMILSTSKKLKNQR